MNYVEVIFNTTSNRNHFYTFKDYKSLVKNIAPDMSMYRSTYLYPEEINHYIEKTGSVGGYRGVRKIDWVILDLDPKDNDRQWFQIQVQNLVEELRRDLGNAFTIAFSGTGYHVGIRAETWGFRPSNSLYMEVKNTIKTQFSRYVEQGLLDLSILSPAGYYRTPNSLNKKTQLYKVFIPIDLFLDSDYSEIQAIAKEQTKEFPKVSANFGKWQHLIKRQNTVSFTKTGNPTTIATCIHKLVERGAVNGERHASMLRIAAHLKRRGIPIDLAYRSLLSWVNDDTAVDEWRHVINQAYKVGYNYGCEDALLKQFCDQKCIFYKNKNYGSDNILSQESVRQLLSKRVSEISMFSLELNRLFGLVNTDGFVDTNIYPGELVTLIGPTKLGKTALLQNIAVGWSPAEERIVKSTILDPTLFISLELSPSLLYRRFIQVVSGKSKLDIIRDYRSGVKKDIENALGHIHYTSTDIDVNAIENLINEIQPKLVILDHVGFLNMTKANETSQINYVYKRLVDIKRKYPSIFLVVSHISREEAKRMEREGQRISLHSGIYSSAIEQSSDKVLGLEWHRNQIMLSMLANRDGQTWKDLVLYRNKTNFRFTRKEHEG